MKSDLDASIDNVPNDSFPAEYKLDLPVAKKLSQEILAPSKAEMDQFFAEMSKRARISPPPQSYSRMCGMLRLQESPSANNKRYFVNKFLDHTYPDLLTVCQGIDIKITTEQITQAESDTITQAKGTNFFKHRIGRIGASQCKVECNHDPALPSQTLIQSVCYTELNE